MTSRREHVAIFLLLCVLLFSMGMSDGYAAADPLMQGVGATVKRGVKSSEISSALHILVMLTALSLIPAMLIATTSFLRILIVLSMLRHAIGMQDTPPNTALMTIALFLTVFSMSPVWNEVDQKAWQPFRNNSISVERAIDVGIKPVREFMVRQTRESDLSFMVEMAHAKQPETIDDISTFQLIPAFMLSELRTAFQIGFMIFLPFLLIDLIVATVLTSLGMMMVPPVMISLPLKVLMFILIDGWMLVTRSLLASFH
jgi:flagellar biosynthetic protein FliP